MKIHQLISIFRPARRGGFAARLLVVILQLAAARLHAGDPRTNSWYTAYAGQYARIYTNDLCRTNGYAVTTWTNGTTIQSLPSYCGVQEVYSSSNWVYVRSTGLGSHVMGAWYLNSAHTTYFPAFPTNQQILFRIPRTNAVPATKSTSGGGAVGIAVDGVVLFNNWDAYVWNGTNDAAQGQVSSTGYWYRDAYVNEGLTFDPANAHQPGSGQYHYHANPPALRYELGDNVNFNTTTKVYTEGTNTTKHSPILGWAADGFPIYGPYGYSSSNNPSSGVRRMVSGYVIRNGSYGTSNLTVNGRSTLPAWACRLFNVASNIQSGPAVSTSYPLGRYQEDNDYLGDHGYVIGRDFDLDEYNGRYCVTPEFPAGTYAYFVAIDTNGNPAYPYNLGMAYFGSPAGGSVSSITEAVVTNFLGNTNLPAKLAAPAVAAGNVTLTWSAVEGGSYEVVATTNLTAWTVIASNLAPNKITGAYTNTPAAPKQFYRVARTAVASYTSAGVTSITAVSGSTVAPGGSASRGTTVSVTITLPSTPPNPPANAPVSSVTLAGSITGTSITDSTSGTVVATFSIPSTASTGLQTISVSFTSGPTYTVSGLTIN